jgi:hypothetical protein
MSTATQQAVLFEIDEKSWDTHLDRVERWFHHMQTVQTAFRKLVEDTLPKMHDSHLREYLTEILERAKDHESKTDDLLRMIGRDPSASRKALGTGFAKAQELVADLKGFAGGAMSGWRDLQQLASLSQFVACRQGKCRIFSVGTAKVWPTNAACRQGRFRA